MKTRSTVVASEHTSLVQPRGQVTIPKDARDEMGLKPGDEVVWIRNPSGRWEIWTVEALLDELTKDAGELLAFLDKVKKNYRPQVY